MTKLILKKIFHNGSLEMTADVTSDIINPARLEKSMKSDNFNWACGACSTESATYRVVVMDSCDAGKHRDRLIQAIECHTKTAKDLRLLEGQETINFVEV